MRERPTQSGPRLAQWRLCELIARFRLKGTIAPSLHVIPPGTLPWLCHNPEPHSDQVVSVSQRTAPSVQVSPAVEEDVGAGAEEDAAEVAAGEEVVAGEEVAGIETEADTDTPTEVAGAEEVAGTDAEVDGEPVPVAPQSPTGAPMASSASARST